MKIICPNFKNEEVAKEFEELKNATSESAAYHIWSQNNGNGIDKAPNGEPSKLFSDLLNHYNGDRVAAIQAKAKIFSKSFKNWFGESKVVDENGEPLIVYHGSNHNIEKFEKTKLGSNTGKGEYKDSNTGEIVEIDSNNAFFASSNKLVAANYAFMGNEKESNYFEVLFQDLYNVLDNGNAYNNTVETREDANNAFKRIGDSFPELKSLTDKVPETGKIPKETRDELKIKLQEYYKKFHSNNNQYSARSFTNSYNYYTNIIKSLKKHLTEDLEKFKNNDRTVFDREQGSIRVSFKEHEQYIFYDTNEKRFVYTDTNNRRGYLDTLTIPQLQKVFNNMLSTARKALAQVNKELSESGYADKTYVGYYYVSMKNPLIHDYNGSSFPDNYVTESGKRTEYPTGYIAGRQVRKALKDGNDGVIYRNVIDPIHADSFGFFEPNQIKSIDNQGTFSTQDNNIYNQNVISAETPTGRNAKLQTLLQKLYPQINLSEFNNPNLRGQAIVRSNKAGEVLINAALENEDTLPHEYAHHYIAWFRNAPIVQRAIKAFGTEEKLVQAIGENAVEGTRWYNKIWNYIKGLFNKNQRVLNQITKDFLDGKQYMSALDVITEEYHNQSFSPIEIDETKKTISAIDNVYVRLIEDTQARIKDLLHYKVLDNKKIDQLNNLVNTLSKMESDQAVFHFIGYMQPDIDTAKERIDKLADEVNTALENNVKLDIDPERLLQIKTGFIGYYATATINIQNLLDDYSVEAYINDEEALNKLKTTALKVRNNFDEINRKYRFIAGEVAKQLILDYAKQHGSTSLNELRVKLDATDVDISWFETLMGSPIYARDEILRIMADKLLNAKNEVADKTISKGTKLVTATQNVEKKDIKLLREKGKNGKDTGFFVRPLNYGQHYQDLMGFRRDLAAKFGLADAYKRPEDPKELRKYNKALNDWHAKHSERRFIPEYYDLFNNLSDEAIAEREKYQDEIDYYLSKVRDKDGDIHKEELSDADYAALETAEKAKANLANHYNMDGTLKDGISLQIANELSELNNKLRDNLTYTPNFEKFKASYAKAKKLSKELFKKWLERNTIVKIDDQFYKDLEKITQNYEKSDTTLSLEDQRRELTRLYRKEDGSINWKDMPSNVKRTIADLDYQINTSRAHDKAIQGVMGGRLDSIAHIEVDPEYSAQYERAAKEGETALNEWLAENTYEVNGSIQPASFWTRLVPNDPKYLTRYPNKSWAEVDRDSHYYNSNFNEALGESVIPKKSLYDNSTAFKKMASNKNLLNLYNQLIETMDEANSEMKFLRRPNKYMLPQIEGGAWTMIRSEDTILKGLGHWFGSIVSVRDQDEGFNRETARRSDGSVVNLVPTRYLKMLENPAAITPDTVGSVIKYYEMATNYSVMKNVAPELELITEKIADRPVIDRKEGRKRGTDSNTYKRAKELLDKHIYGKENSDWEWNIGGKTISISKSLNLIASYTRILGISQNPNVILTGLLTNKIQNRLEALSGYYYDSTDLAKASLEIAKSYASTLSGIGSAVNKNKIVGLMEYAQVGRNVRESFEHLNQSRVIRTINQHYWYFGHEMVDYATKGKMLVAVYMAHKYDPATKSFRYKSEFIRSYKGDKRQAKAAWNRLTTTLYDAYEMKDGMLVVKDQFKEAVTPILANKVRNTARMIGSRIDGQLSDIDKAYIHGHTLWQFLTIFRNFMVQNFQTGFHTKGQYNYSTGRYVRSYWGAALAYTKSDILPRTWLWNIFKNFVNQDKIAQLKEMAFDYDGMKDFEKAAFKRVAYTMALSVFLMFLAVPLLNGWADDDKDNWFKNEAAYLAARVTLETKGNISPKEWFDLFNSPTAATNTITSMYDALGVWFDAPNETIHKGPYRNMKRYQRSLIKMTPFKLIHEAKDPRSKREYLEHQILSL